MRTGQGWHSKACREHCDRCTRQCSVSQDCPRSESVRRYWGGEHRQLRRSLLALATDASNRWGNRSLLLQVPLRLMRCAFPPSLPIAPLGPWEAVNYFGEAD